MRSQFFSAMQGLVAFAIASALASVMILQYDNYFSAAILTGGLGALLLSLLMIKNKPVFWKMALALDCRSCIKTHVSGLSKVSVNFDYVLQC